MTVEEAKTLHSGQLIYTYAEDVRKRANKSGKRWIHARVTSVKTWKRTPERIEVRAVYGLKDFFSVSSVGENYLQYWHSTITHDEGDAS